MDFERGGKGFFGAHRLGLGVVLLEFIQRVVLGHAGDTLEASVGLDGVFKDFECDAAGVRLERLGVLPV